MGTNETIFKKELGKLFRKARTAKSLTQSELAYRADISVQFYGRIERGTALPSLPTLFVLVMELDVKLDDLPPHAVPPPPPSRYSKHLDRDRPTKKQIHLVIELLRNSSPRTVRIITLVMAIIREERRWRRRSKRR